jgi:hypothetical protein
MGSHRDKEKRKKKEKIRTTRIEEAGSSGPGFPFHLFTPQFCLCLLQPEAHVHLAVHHRGGGQVLPGLFVFTDRPVEPAEAEVIVQHGYELAFPFQSALGVQDLLGEVLWRIGIRGDEPMRGGGGGLYRVPQLLQNLDLQGSSVPHEPQVRLKRPPHSRQKLDCGGLSCWHWGHFIEFIY